MYTYKYINSWETSLVKRTVRIHAENLGELEKQCFLAQSRWPTLELCSEDLPYSEKPNLHLQDPQLFYWEHACEEAGKEHDWNKMDSMAVCVVVKTET